MLCECSSKTPNCCRFVGNLDPEQAEAAREVPAALRRTAEAATADTLSEAAALQVRQSTTARLVPQSIRCGCCLVPLTVLKISDRCRRAVLAGDWLQGLCGCDAMVACPRYFRFLTGRTLLCSSNAAVQLYQKGVQWRAQKAVPQMVSDTARHILLLCCYLMTHFRYCASIIFHCANGD